MHTYRSPGIHLSGVLRYIGINQKIIKGVDPVTGKWIGDSGADLNEEDMPLRMVLGMAWEEYAATLYPEMNWQPGELCKDSITGSPDGVTLIEIDGEEVPVIEEFKLTWKSARQGILKQTMWLWQGAGYCIMYGTNWCRFNILYVNGEYEKFGMGGPVYRRYLVYYSDRELAGIWAMVLHNRDNPAVRIE